MSDAKTIVRWVVWHPARSDSYAGDSAEVAKRVAVYETRPDKTRWRTNEDPAQIWGTMAALGWRCTRIEEKADA